MPSSLPLVSPAKAIPPAPTVTATIPIIASSAQTIGDSLDGLREVGLWRAIVRKSEGGRGGSCASRQRRGL